MATPGSVSETTSVISRPVVRSMPLAQRTSVAPVAMCGAGRGEYVARSVCAGTTARTQSPAPASASAASVVARMPASIVTPGR